MAKQASFRWREDEDADVIAALLDYAASGGQTDVIRLAIWRLIFPDRDVPPSLRALDRMFERVAVAAPQAVAAGVSDEQREFYAALVDRLNSVPPPAPHEHSTATQPANWPEPTTTGGELESSGIDMGDRERPKLGEAVGEAVLHTPKTRTPQ